MKTISSTRLILLIAMYFVVFANFRFFSEVLDVYPASAENAPFLASLAIVLLCLTTIVLAPVWNRFILKFILILLLLIASVSAYFMDSYEIVIDELMIENALETNTAEALDLLTPSLALYVFLLCVVPACLIVRVRVRSAGFRKEFLPRLGLFVLPLLTCIGIAFALGDFYASFLRDHKPLRYYVNPGYPLFSAAKALFDSVDKPKVIVTPVGVDATVPAGDAQRELVILIVGETARADRFSLNGYARKTNPLLEKETLVSFTNVRSCGTSTATSVPCMFSKYEREHYSKAKAAARENALDVLAHAGINVLWLDNNSSSKGVADRVPFVDYRRPKTNPVCDPECRDEGMLSGLQEYIDSHRRGDIFIVLHSMGSHGPAYYKRYPAAFEQFTPVCRSNQLQKCSQQEIDNAYDNTILYTDYFLSRVIALLKENDHNFDTTMFYISDHGESLGENGIYLHGLPWLMAPDAQTHVPAIMWFGANNDDVDRSALSKLRDAPFSHDNLFHTIIGFSRIETEVYDSQMDMLSRARRPP